MSAFPLKGSSKPSYISVSKSFPQQCYDFDCPLCIMTIKHASVWREWNFCFGNEWGRKSGSWLLHIPVHLLPQHQGRSHSCSSRVPSCGTCRTMRGPGSAGRGLGKAGPVWPPSMTGWPTQLMRERLWMDVTCLDSSKAFDTVSHSIHLEKWLLVAWMGVLCSG